MNDNITSKINELVIEYFDSKNENILSKIEYLLKIQEYQSWKLKYNLRLIEHPDKFGRDEKIQEFENLFDCDNAYSKHHLVLPLLLHLFAHHNASQSALESSLSLMNASKLYLKPGDFAKTKTGVQRFITNTRFASLELRNLGLLRSDSKRFYKYWQLSLFGIIVAGHIYIHFQDKLSPFFPKGFSWHEAKDSNANILKYYIEISLLPNSLKSLFNYIFIEDIVTKHFDLYNRKFLSFTTYLTDVLNDGYSSHKRSTKELISFLNSFNTDQELTKLADSIKLKKDIEVNLEDVYHIINIDRDAKDNN